MTPLTVDPQLETTPDRPAPPVTVAPAEHACQLHGTHRPEPLVIVKHHIQPQGMGGPDEPGNWLWVCDTGHRNVHTLMGPLVNHGAMLPGGTHSERAAARDGYDRWIAAGRPGNPHASYGVIAGP